MIILSKRLRILYPIVMLVPVLAMLAWLLITAFQDPGRVINIPVFEFSGGRLTLEALKLFVVTLLAALAWMYGVTIVFTVIANQNMVRIVNILMKQCDPQPYVDTLTAMLPMVEQVRARPLWVYRKVNFAEIRRDILHHISSGYLGMGNYEAAKEALDSMNGFTRKTGAEIQKECAYLNNLMYCFIAVKEFAGAEKCLQDMDAIRKHEKLSGFTKKSLADMYYRDVSRYRSELTGKCDGLSPFFCLMFEKADNEYQKVITQFTLGQIYLYEGQTANAKEAFTYVIDNGNKLYCVEQAKALCPQTT